MSTVNSLPSRMDWEGFTAALYATLADIAMRNGDRPMNYQAFRAGYSRGNRGARNAALSLEMRLSREARAALPGFAREFLAR